MLLSGLSIAAIYMFILNVFYENRLKYKKNDLIGILLIAVILIFGYRYEEIPSFIYYIFEPVTLILIIRVIKKKSSFDAIIGYFAVLISSIIADIFVALIATPLGYLEFLANLNYKASAVLYWIIPIGISIYRKSFHHKYLTFKNQSKLRQEKYTISIYFVHITILMLLYHTNYQVALNGSYSGFEKFLYWMVIILYTGFIYAQLILYNKNLKKENKRRFEHKSKHLKSDLLAQSYALTHDLKNMIHLTEEDPVASIIEAKKKTAQELGIDLRIHLEGSLAFKRLDFSIVLSILLDNALEHLVGWPILPQWVHLKMTPEGLRISNPLKEYNLHRMTEYGYSSKTSPSAGYGLSNAMELVEKNNHTMTYSVDQKVLTCLIESKKL